jgi:hypothetical protein
VNSRACGWPSRTSEAEDSSGRLRRPTGYSYLLISELRRDPDATGFTFWLTKLNQFGGDLIRAEMVKAFLSSDEYRKRFGP